MVEVIPPLFKNQSFLVAINPWKPRRMPRVFIDWLVDHFSFNVNYQTSQAQNPVP